MMKGASETIFTTDRNIIPMEDVLFIEKRCSECSKSVNQICIVLKGTTYNREIGDYNNAVFLIDSKDGSYQDATSFVNEWCFYRSEIDKVDTSLAGKE